MSRLIPEARAVSDNHGEGMTGERTVSSVRKHQLTLEVLDGPDKSLIAQVDTSRITSGSAPGNDLCLRDQSVSRHHFAIVASDGLYMLRDNGSRNGTYVNGVRMFEGAIQPGTEIRVGRTRLLFDIEGRLPKRVSTPERDRLGMMAGNSVAMRTVFGQLERVAPTALTCLITGETGTGKELCARAIHDHSERRDGPFVVIDCGAVSENLIEDKLFGHERGAFTGADKARAGAFEEARGGSVFLDEIGELPLRLQPKLLRALEQREVTRVGAHRPLALDVRLIAATHRDLRAMVEEGSFRKDLFFRLSEAVIRLPPLRTRSTDIVLLANTVLRSEAPAVVLHPDARTYLERQDWPGNVRELRNLIRRAAASASDNIITSDLLRELHEPMSVITQLDELLSQDPPRELATLPPASPRAPTVTLSPPGPQAVASEPTAASSQLVGVDLNIGDAAEAYRAAYVRAVYARYEGDDKKICRHMGVHLKYARRLLRRYGLV
jgi:DNA-binding NtrC family response regulator